MVARVAYLILSWIALAQSMSGDGDIVPLPFNTSCEGARNSYDRFLLEKRLNEAGENVIYKELQSAHRSSKCSSDKTCCSSTAEDHLATMAVDTLLEETRNLLKERINLCDTSLLKNALVRHINNSKNELILILERAYGTFFKKLDIFDEFYQYLQDAVVTGNSCNIGYKFNKVFFEVYLAVLEANPQVVTDHYPNTREFHECLYNYFLTENRVNIYSYFRGLTRSFNRTLYYIRALNTADEALKSVLTLDLTPQCRHALQDMTYCAQCAGYSTSLKPCPGLCTNTLRGCLVDFAELHAPLTAFASAIVRMKEFLEHQVSPWVHIYQLQVNFVDMITNTASMGSNINIQILVRCNPNGASRQTDQHSPQMAEQGTAIWPRSTVNPPSVVLNSSAYCFVDVVPLFQTLPEKLCGGMASVGGQCWNGKSMKSYEREVLPYDRASQLDNPELIVCRSAPRMVKQAVQKLKLVTKEMNIITSNGDCPEDDEDCSVNEQRCDFSVPTVTVSVNTLSDTDSSSPPPTPSTTTPADSSSGHYSSSGSGVGSGGCEEGTEGCAKEEEKEEEEVEACLVEPSVTLFSETAAPSSTMSSSSPSPSPSSSSPTPTPTPTTDTHPPTVEGSAHFLTSTLFFVLLSALLSFML